MNILFEMRPALAGYAGIPQETRLLFRELVALPDVSVDGLVQSSNRILARGLPARRFASSKRATALSVDAQINRLSRVVVSMQAPSTTLLPGGVHRLLEMLKAGWAMAARQAVGASHELGHFDASRFRDFIWRALFARTLDPADIDEMVGAGFRIATVPWSAMHRFGLATRPFGGWPLYPRLDTRGYDLMLAETPFPARVSAGTRLLVRYHDAVPMLMPHTIIDKAFHQASHYQALRTNVRQGAYFACVSDATRADLLAMFPEAEPRTITIHNMVSRFYFRENASASRVEEVLRTRRLRVGKQVSAGLAPAMTAPPDYLLQVSTIEPRKNHLALLAAWERLRTEGHANLRLVLVGALGWDHESIVQPFRPWIQRGELVMLVDVPADELRLLYRHARVTVCPSLYEGFDYSGIESMRSGGIVAASDIPVHRAIYADAAEYFNPYSPEDIAAVISRLLATGAEERRQRLVDRGDEVSARYLPQRLLPEWQRFLESIQTAAARPRPAA